MVFFLFFFKAFQTGSYLFYVSAWIVQAHTAVGYFKNPTFNIYTHTTNHVLLNNAAFLWSEYHINKQTSRVTSKNIAFKPTVFDMNKNLQQRTYLTIFTTSFFKKNSLFALFCIKGVRFASHFLCVYFYRR